MPAKKKSTKPTERSIEELRQSEARFRTMFDTAAVGIGTMSLDRMLMDANPALCRMFGMSHEELIGQTPIVVTHPDDYQHSTQQFIKSFIRLFFAIFEPVCILSPNCPNRFFHDIYVTNPEK
jgi:PAS domain-containing protein